MDHLHNIGLNAHLFLWNNIFTISAYRVFKLLLLTYILIIRISITIRYTTVLLNFWTCCTPRWNKKIYIAIECKENLKSILSKYRAWAKTRYSHLEFFTHPLVFVNTVKFLVKRWPFWYTLLCHKCLPLTAYHWSGFYEFYHCIIYSALAVN